MKVKQHNRHGKELVNLSAPRKFLKELDLKNALRACSMSAAKKAARGKATERYTYGGMGVHSTINGAHFALDMMGERIVFFFHKVPAEAGAWDRYLVAVSAKPITFEIDMVRGTEPEPPLESYLSLLEADLTETCPWSESHVDIVSVGTYGGCVQILRNGRAWASLAITNWAEQHGGFNVKVKLIPVNLAADGDDPIWHLPELIAQKDEK